MDYDPRSEPHNLAHDPTTSLVVPRPIGWITTISPTGVVNLAPYSFFNMIASHPPFVMFSSNTRKHSQLHAESGSSGQCGLLFMDADRSQWAPFAWAPFSWARVRAGCAAGARSSKAGGRCRD